MHFKRENNLVDNIVFVDGTARCGKSLLAPILTSLERVEIERMEGIFDYISMGYYYGSIKKDVAISILRTVADEYTYNSFLSRNTNFRFKDHSSVFRSQQASRYYKRLLHNEGPETLEKIKSTKPIYQNQTHDQLRNFKLFCETWPNRFRMIEILRNPIELVDAWVRRRWGIRFAVDPLAFTPCMSFGDKVVPIYAEGWEQEYLKMSPENKVVRMLYELQKLNSKIIRGLNKTDFKQLLIIKFEDFVSSPILALGIISNFLETTVTKDTNKAMKKQNVPRFISRDSVDKKLLNLKPCLSDKSLNLINWMLDDYHSMKSSVNDF